MKKVAIIVLDWNGAEVTGDCLHSLMEMDEYANLQVQVVVVDNGSQPSAASQLQAEFPSVRFLRSESNLGFAAGNNLGIRYALENGFDYTLLLNNDTTVDTSFLSHLVYAMEATDNVAAAQPKILFQHQKNLIWNAGTRFHSWLGITRTRGYKETDKGQYDLQQYMPWLTGCCILFNNSILKSLNNQWLNEGYATYFEDVELSLRLRNAGHRLLYVPASKIWHIAGYSVERQPSNEGNKSAHIVYTHTRNGFWIVRQFLHPVWRPIALVRQSLYTVSLMGFYTLRGRWKKLDATFRALGDGLLEPLP